MEHLLHYINSLSPDERETFVARCGTSLGYLRKAISTKQPLGESLCINIDRESHGEVCCESLRPEVDWAYLRSTPAQPTPQELTHG